MLLEHGISNPVKLEHDAKVPSTPLNHKPIPNKAKCKNLKALFASKK
jgi:hypothetical protein